MRLAAPELPVVAYAWLRIAHKQDAIGNTPPTLL